MKRTRSALSAQTAAVWQRRKNCQPTFKWERSKALGAAGGYICGSTSLIEWLTNRSRSLIYSAAPPAAVAAAAMAGIEFLQTPEGEERRRALWKNIDLLHQLIASETNHKPESAIFPFIVGQENDAMNFAHALQKE